MSLTNEISKNNEMTKQLLTIKEDLINTLVSFGGNSVDNLSEVNKEMKSMIGHFKKFARGTYSIDINKSWYECKDISTVVVPKSSRNDDNVCKFNKDHRIKIPVNLSFEPKIVFLSFTHCGYSLDWDPYYRINVDSINNYVENDSDIKSGKLSLDTSPTHYQLRPLFIEEFNSKNIELNVYFSQDGFSSSFETYKLLIKGCTWIALG